MKNKFVILLGILLMFSFVNAEKIYVTDSKSQADLIIKVVDSYGAADLVIYVTESKSLSDTDGNWYFTSSRSEADLVVYYSESYSGATKVYFTESRGYSQILHRRPMDGDIQCRKANLYKSKT